MATFPFTAVVGQDALKTALLLAIVEITSFDNRRNKFAYVFMRDPEGNILDLKQRM